MKKSLGIIGALSLILALASPAAAQEFKIFGSYWETTDLDDTFGGGLSLGFPLGSSPAGFYIRGSYYQELDTEPLDAAFDNDEGIFQDEGLEILPIEAGFDYTFPSNGPMALSIGAGGTYFLLDSTLSRVDIDDELGWHASVGARFGDDQGASFFAEALYRTTEATITFEEEDGIDDPDVQDQVNIDLDGFAVNAGLLWRF